MYGGIVRVCAAAMLCALVGVALRDISGGFSTAIKVGGAVLIFSMVVLAAAGIIESAGDVISRFDGYSEITGYWGTMLRALGIALLCRICSDVCRDCGEGTIAGGVETAGKITILALSLPMIEDILICAEELLSSV